jgi:hypothetical protein
VTTLVAGKVSAMAGSDSATTAVPKGLDRGGSGSGGQLSVARSFGDLTQPWPGRLIWIASRVSILRQ